MTRKTHWRDYLSAAEAATIADADDVDAQIKKLRKHKSTLLRMRTLIMNRCMQRKRYAAIQARKQK